MRELTWPYHSLTKTLCRAPATLCLLVVLLLSVGLTAQKGALPIKYEPVVSFQASGGYFFWNAREVYDSMPAVTRDHNTALNRGFRYGGDLLFHFNEGFSLGVTYRQLGTKNTTTPNHWNIPVTDSNNRVVIDPNTGNLLYGPRYGSISETIELWFLGVRLSKEFEINPNLYLGISIAPGMVNFFESGNFVGYRVETTGSNLAVDIGLDAKYQFDRNWSALLQFSLFNASIASPNYTDLQQSVVNYPLSEPQSVVHYSVNAGIRFTINKRNRRPERSRASHPEMPAGRDKKRFQLPD